MSNTEHKLLKNSRLSLSLTLIRSDRHTSGVKADMPFHTAHSTWPALSSH